MHLAENPEIILTGLPAGPSSLEKLPSKTNLVSCGPDECVWFLNPIVVTLFSIPYEVVAKIILFQA